MPSEHQKKRAQAKKEAAKAKGGKKKVDPPAGEENGTNGVESKSNSASKESTPVANTNGLSLTYEEELCLALEEEAR
jgi:hypothetical protein